MKLLRVVSALLLVTLVAPAFLAAQSRGPVIKEEKPGLRARATFSPDSAIAIALRTGPKGAKLTAAELEEEDGLLIYSFDLSVPGKAGVYEIGIDAKTGKVVANEYESPEDEAKEASEDSVKAAARP